MAKVTKQILPLKSLWQKVTQQLKRRVSSALNKKYGISARNRQNCVIKEQKDKSGDDEGSQ